MVKLITRQDHRDWIGYISSCSPEQLMNAKDWIWERMFELFTHE
jgi:hypothetical protein